MAHFILGIDPGVNGAISLTKNGIPLAIWDMPSLPKTTGKGREINATLLDVIFADSVKQYVNPKQDTLEAVLEIVRAMPGQGVTSMFSMGRSYGVIEGILAAHALQLTRVRPQVWKSHFGLLKKHKDAARTCIIDMFPKYVDFFKRKKDVDRADATLIAIWQYHNKRHMELANKPSK